VSLVNVAFNVLTNNLLLPGQQEEESPYSLHDVV